MAGYLDQRKGIYFARLAVPADQQERVGKAQLLRSLKTRSKREAQRLLPVVLAELRRQIEPPDPLRVKLAADHGIPIDWPTEKVAAALDLLRLATIEDQSHEDTISVTVDLPLSGDDQRRLAALDAAVDKFWADRFAPDEADQPDIGGPTVAPPTARPAPPESYRSGPAYRAAVAEIGLDLDHAPTEVGKLRAGLAVPPIFGAAKAVEQVEDQPIRNVAWLMRRYLDEERQPPAKTKDEWVRAAARFAEVAGDRDVRDLAEDGEAVLQFRGLLAALPRALSRADRALKMVEIAEKYADRQVDRLSDASVNKYIAALSSAFAWGKRLRIAPNNPFADAKIKRRGHKGKPKSRRQPYTPDDLKIIFGSPIYTDNYRPNTAGGEAHFWLPLLSVYTGCRLEELGQMDADDVVKVGDVLVFNLSFSEDGDKTQKTESSIRIIPVHDDLIKMGFGRYIEYVKSSGNKKLFPELVKNKYGQYTQGWSTAWGRWCDKLGLTDKNKVFHSFRHNWKRNSLHAQLHPDLARALMGHGSGGGAHGAYGAIDEDLELLRGAAQAAAPRGLDLGHVNWQPGAARKKRAG